MKYIINSTINFYQEINNLTDNNDESQICLLTREKLEDNFITLKCNHKFNYLSLYNELCIQKGKINTLEASKILINQIKCPYCRVITDKILPFIIHDNIELKYGINFPSKYSMQINSCSWVYKNGRNKNNKCNCSSFIFNENNYCLKHHKLYNKLNGYVTDLSNNNLDNLCYGDINKYKKIYTINKLKEILKENELKISGNKNELILRLLNNNITI